MKRTLPIFLLSALGCASHCSTQPQPLFQDNFINLNHWHLEGLKDGVSLPTPHTLRLSCTNSQQGGLGVMAFCKTPLPDHIAIEYDLLVESHNGLLITFLAFNGLQNQNPLTQLPPRSGTFDDYTGPNALARSYHVSVCRYDDAGHHTGVSNWRRNPGLHLMASGPDLCTQTNTPYHIRITKSGPTCRLFVNGSPGPSFTDPQSLPTPLPTTGHIGFRAIGSNATFQISNLKVTPLPPDQKE